MGAIAASIAVVGLESSKKSRYLHMVPAGLAVTEIIYAHEDSWGFGPGSNETGVVVFGLSPGVASNIQQQRTTRWKATPVSVEGSDKNTNATRSYDIGQYLNRYGFGIRIDEEVTRTINDALSSQGNFVDDNGRRVIIVIPKTSKLVIAYRG
ncbi:hypothetical protein [Pseudoduganella armeniaca]|uniref:hypothetical protein n=1 Tax=Pseudoduganella armeniaca TaxID=2072590 RepID=UPI0011B282EC|nr:hypothetical protein [Pseudoduganella armeniaca]